jgi:hypothetical protein
MASIPTMEVRFRIRRKMRFFYARPCDEPAEGWCVAEVEIDPAKGAKWSSTLYENVLSRTANGDESIELLRMTKAQAKAEAKLWNEREAKKPRKR